MVDVIDEVETIKQLLDGGSRWDTTIVAKPSIQVIYNWGKFPSPGIGIYQIDAVPNKDSYGAGKREDKDWRVTIDMRALSRGVVKLYEKAVRKIVQEYSVTIDTVTLTAGPNVGYTNPFKQLWEQPAKDLSDRRKGTHRITIDVLLQDFGITLPTSP
jgi:hypothetical protein